MESHSCKIKLNRRIFKKSKNPIEELLEFQAMERGKQSLRSNNSRTIK